jgi:hypothetical protein
MSHVGHTLYPGCRAVLLDNLDKAAINLLHSQMCCGVCFCPVDRHSAGCVSVG